MESALRWIGEAAKDLSGPIAIILAVTFTVWIIYGVWQMISTDKKVGNKFEEQEKLDLLKAASALLRACLAARIYILEGEDSISRDNVLDQLDNALKLAEDSSTLYPPPRVD
jgi:hypothetical protein